MIKEPIFKGFSSKIYQYILSIMIILMYICVCIEADIYIPAFPQMIEYFGVAEYEIQLVLGVNFLSLCTAVLIVGPLSDCYGRRIVVLIGLALFMLASIILVEIDNFRILLFWRFIQGSAAAVPMVCAGAMLVDTYKGEKVSKLLGMINAVITAAMAGAIVLGTYLSEAYGWRANFIAVMLISIIAFIFFLLFIEETLDVSSRRKLNLVIIFQSYLKVSKSLAFLCYYLFACFPFIIIILYTANFATIFVQHIGVSLESYIYHQLLIMGVFIIFSTLSILLITKRGIDFTKNIGGIISIIGTACLFITSIIDHTQATLVYIAIAIIIAGGSLMSGTFGMKALSIFSEMNGVALASCAIIRFFLLVILLFVSEIYFDGTILPVALIILAYAIVAASLYIYLIKTGKVKLNQGDAA
jgi:MFS transporter, DHA1 family, multidrug resistance protein